MAATLQKQVDRFKLRSQAGKKTAASYTAPKPAAPAAPAAPKPITATAPKPTLAKPVLPVAAAPVVAKLPPVNKPAISKPAVGGDPSEPVAGDNWGGGKTADIHIDLDDKNFGKY
jgi:hypothetical protein